RRSSGPAPSTWIRKWPRTPTCRRRQPEYRNQPTRSFGGASCQALLESIPSERWQRLNVKRLWFVRELLRIQRLRGRRLVISRRLDRTPRRGPDRGNEILFAAVPELDLPRNGRLLGFPADSNAVAQRSEVRVAAAVDRILRARLHARVALP